MTELKSCGVLVVRGDPIREFLLMRHADRWDLPKGHVDQGESDVECALREMEEETGITAADVELDPGFRFCLRYRVPDPRTGGGKWCDKRLVIFLARLKRDVEVLVSEHLGHEWFPWDPPHHIQEQTIDPLLATVEEYVPSRSASKSGPAVGERGLSSS